MNLAELMIEIRNSPEKFLQDDCIFQLRAFIRGFIFAKDSSAKIIGDDRKLLDAIDLKIRNKYGIAPSERIAIEEILDDYEGDNALAKYLELWFKYAQH